MNDFKGIEKFVSEKSSKRVEAGSIPEDERMIYANEAIHSDSSLKDYERWMTINTDRFVGKKILDIGGMPNGKFARAAKTKGIDLVTLNPSISEIAKERPIKGRNVIAGYVQNLPFQDETFDYEISYGAIPSHLAPVEKEYSDAFNEIFRTLKPGGQAYLVPVYGSVLKTEVFQKIKEGLLNRGAEIILDDVGFVLDENKAKVKVFKMTVKKKSRS
ncbi:MAG: class I SAM-dependent methyltransferase [Candidatus Doudnabacteria bacterium]|nr:class I SAM-dependent methyltransferase [Candidatus Doudnabacteria bacterium]